MVFADEGEELLGPSGLIPLHVPHDRDFPKGLGVGESDVGEGLVVLGRVG